MPSDTDGGPEIGRGPIIYECEITRSVNFDQQTKFEFLWKLERRISFRGEKGKLCGRREFDSFPNERI